MSSLIVIIFSEHYSKTWTGASSYHSHNLTAIINLMVFFFYSAVKSLRNVTVKTSTLKTQF